MDWVWLKSYIKIVHGSIFGFTKSLFLLLFVVDGLMNGYAFWYTFEICSGSSIFRAPLHCVFVRNRNRFWKYSSVLVAVPFDLIKLICWRSGWRRSPIQQVLDHIMFFSDLHSITLFLHFNNAFNGSSPKPKHKSSTSTAM